MRTFLINAFEFNKALLFMMMPSVLMMIIPDINESAETEEEHLVTRNNP